MIKYDTEPQVEEYYGTFAAEPANEDVYSLSSYDAAEYEEHISRQSNNSLEVS
jgi:hypothetical protein